MTKAGVVWAVPSVLSYNDVPFESLAAAFAGFSLPRPHDDEPFSAGRVMQHFGLRGNAKALTPFVLNVCTGEVMWIDTALTSRGYGHNIGSAGPRLGRIAADLWEHFGAGNRATLLELAAWHAAARARLVVVAHPDGTATRLPPAPPAATVAAIRAAVGTGGTVEIPAKAQVFACATDAARLAAIAGTDVADGSAALLVEGTAGAPWTPLTPGDLLSALAPAG
ncbi:hypothetical protein [Dactylosporangium sp. CA-233914]|uniref:hypothetical protein n=1 Tax=Dactylosporangium sp. CA-233914 TaxID=3239934 RepID=UPI003D8C468E